MCTSAMYACLRVLSSQPTCAVRQRPTSVPASCGPLHSAQPPPAVWQLLAVVWALFLSATPLFDHAGAKLLRQQGDASVEQCPSQQGKAGLQPQQPAASGLPSLTRPSARQQQALVCLVTRAGPPACPVQGRVRLRKWRRCSCSPGVAAWRPARRPDSRAPFCCRPPVLSADSRRQLPSRAAAWGGRLQGPPLAAAEPARCRRSMARTAAAGALARTA